LLAFLCGTQVNPLEIRNIPADFGRQNFAAPWTTRKFIFLSLLIFFHTFPFSKGETMTPPFGKGRLGGISGKSSKPLH
jgi:hypothetical protein